MSETQELVPPVPPPVPPDIAVTTRQEPKQGGGTQEVFVVTFGTPARTIEVVELDLGAQFDLAEVSGATPSSNVSWHNMAFISASVQKIDGVPTRPATSKQNLRATLTTLGVDGMRAAGLVVVGYRGGPATMSIAEEDHRSVVGNSLGTPGSPSA